MPSNICTLDLDIGPLTSSWYYISSLDPTIHDLGVSNSTCFGIGLVAFECDPSPLDCDLGCIGCNSLAYGDFGDLGGDASWLPNRFGTISGS